MGEVERFSLDHLPRSIEALELEWFADLVNGHGEAEGLPEPLRGVLSLATHDIAEAQGMELLRIKHARDEETRRLERARAQEEVRRLAEKREQAERVRNDMLARLRVTIGWDDSESTIGVADVAKAVPSKWIPLTQFLVDHAVEFVSWVSETDGDEAAASLSLPLREHKGTSAALDAVLVELYLAYIEKPRPVFRGRPLTPTSLADLARKVTQEGSTTAVEIIDALFKSRVLDRFTAFDNHNDVTVLSAHWQSWVDDWRAARPQKRERDVSWATAMLLLAAADEPARSQLRADAERVAELGSVAGVTRRLKENAGASPGWDVALVEVSFATRGLLLKRLRKSLPNRSLPLRGVEDLLRRLKEETEWVATWARSEKHRALARNYFAVAGASDEHITALELLLEAAPSMMPAGDRKEAVLGVSSVTSPSPSPRAEREAPDTDPSPPETISQPPPRKALALVRGLWWGTLSGSVAWTGAWVFGWFLGGIAVVMGFRGNPGELISPLAVLTGVSVFAWRFYRGYTL